MMKLPFSALEKGTKGMLKKLCYCFLVSLVLQSHNAAAEVFECHFDICDTNNKQYCNEDEKRCDYCNCDPQTVIQCLEICAKEMETTTVLPLTEITKTPQTSGSGDNTFLVVAVSMLLVFAIVGALLVVYLLVKKKYCFSEPQTPTSSTTSSKDTITSKDSFEIRIVDSPIFKKAKLPTEEQGHQRFDSKQQIHTSPTDDIDAKRHKRLIDPIEIAIHEEKNRQDPEEETLLKLTMY